MGLLKYIYDNLEWEYCLVKSQNTEASGPVFYWKARKIPKVDPAESKRALVTDRRNLW
jgi:hypothetical protein